MPRQCINLNAFFTTQVHHCHCHPHTHPSRNCTRWCRVQLCKVSIRTAWRLHRAPLSRTATGCAVRLCDAAPSQSCSLCCSALCALQAPKSPRCTTHLTEGLCFEHQHAEGRTHAAQWGKSQVACNAASLFHGEAGSGRCAAVSEHSQPQHIVTLQEAGDSSESQAPAPGNPFRHTRASQHDVQYSCAAA